ncbi:FAD-binding oxidoreductase [Fulvivirga lutimaris]|uniref:FAD-binding oxidoreductase n=1 Tax=Fulvivirga lutimaris TaxID=1819566 RepID=UPI0012BD5655|nr:FAD-binding oxidoreductase [Fulvivirga lutimaris]MTI38750.1 FAD-binding oxidoreductase [Fulvivirga lutimaris]
MKKISGWGNYPLVDSEINRFDTERELVKLLASESKTIARGNARSYGDSALAHNVISSLSHNRMLYFDTEKGILKCESGVLFNDILDVIVPKGWFLPVTPGTKFITVGGAIASDVHGKNHHGEGSFSNYLDEFEIACADGSIKICSPSNEQELYQATCGGMGLTGVILNATFRLKKIESAYISQKQIKAKNLDEIVELFDEYKSATYSMAWIDCLKGGNAFGRSILICGEHASFEELSTNQKKAPLNLKPKKKLNVPFNFPAIALNPFSIKAFNALYYAKNYKKVMEGVIPYEPFFYPLDAINNWNRMYGKNGFVQYQFVLPKEGGKEGLVKILKKIRSKGMGSFLAVLKAFGEQNDLIAFPMEGLTLALDFPVRKGLFEFLNELDVIVLEYGGRIYLTKDARMDGQTLAQSYPNFSKWKAIVEKYNPNFKFASTQSDRLNITS